MRTVLYARFSSTLQNSRSIEDQVALLRERCERENWEVVDVFTDYAISGAAGIDENAGLVSMPCFSASRLAASIRCWPRRPTASPAIRATLRHP
jgi:hypothetical protein